MKISFLYNNVLCSVFTLFAHYTYAQTYADVKSIVDVKCVSCHNSRTGDAPFSLETFKDIKKRIQTVRKTIADNYMPPWTADPHYQDYANNRSLSPKDKSLLIQWIDSGAEESAIARTTKPGISSFSNSTQRAPDLLLKIDKSFIVKGDNKEHFISFKVPFNLSEEKNIEAVEFFSNNKKIIHHANYMFCSVPDNEVDVEAGPTYIDGSNDANREKASPYQVYQKDPVFYTGWIPGASKEYYPDGFGWQLPKRGVIIFTVHYSALSADENSNIGVHLYFRKKAAERDIRIISLGSGGIGEQDIHPSFLIPPNKVSTFSLKVMTPEDQSVLYVWPHMHYLGKQFLAYAITPAKDTVPLVRIPEWNFKWQELYRMKKFKKIPAGSVIHISGMYDNTSNNPQNPHSPPQYVASVGNMTSTDEMMTLLIIYTPYKEGDEDIDL
ncbi:cytochrome c [Niabella sp. CJ426]|uniref:cytochrome c n=1 Tax=Niabella sp. CJ426 TaxID=3393740 RepID=UPI003D056521